MNESDVRSAVARRIEAADVNRRIGRDRLRFVDISSRDLATLPERAFTLEVVGPPQRLDYMACVAYMVEFECVVFYAAAPGIEDRIAEDASAITSSVYTLHTESEDVWDGEARALPPAADDGAIQAPFSIIVKYRGS